MKKSFLIAVMILGFTLDSKMGFAEDAGKLMFSEFLKKVQAHYPLLKKQQARVDQAIATEHEAVAGFLPRFKGVSSWTMGDDPVYVFGTLLKQGAFTQGDFDVSKLNAPDQRSNLSFGVEGQWTLFDAFDTISRVGSAGQWTRSEKLKDEFSRMEVLLLAIEAFHRAVLQNDLDRVSKELLSNSQKDLSEAESLNQKGMVLGADFYAAKLSGGMIERMKNRFERDLESAKVLLNVLMGEEPLTERNINYEISPVTSESENLKGWLETAYTNRRDLEALEAAILSSKHERFRQKMSFLPRISAFGNLEDNAHDWNHASGNYLVGVKGDMDIFDATYGARVERAALKLKESIEDKNALKDSITQSLAEENGRYQTILADLPIADRMMEDAKKAMELTEKLYREGKKSVKDLLDIRKAYLETTIQAYETRFYAQTSYSRLLFLAGKLDEGAAQKIAEGLKDR